MPKRTKIMATVGPASGSKERLTELVAAGVDVFRINFSHGSPEQRSRFLENIRAVEREQSRPLAVCGDLCGPKIRVGVMRDDQDVELESGRELVIQREAIAGTAERISTTLPELIDAVSEGSRLLLADGRLRLEVIRSDPPESITCRVLRGGTLGGGKGVNLPDSDLPIPAMTEKDREDVIWIAEHDFDYCALSFVQRSGDVVNLRQLLDEAGSKAHIIAKIEKPQALRDIDGIIAEADAVMVARGDLGVEMDYWSVPTAQKIITYKCELAGKPSIIATEMLESMIQSPRPTRAEVSDVANAVFDHADAVMLSAESSIGEYPVEAVHVMRQTVLEAEHYLDDYRDVEAAGMSEPRITAALASSIRRIQQLQSIACISLFTTDGTSARVFAKSRLKCPILALASDVSAARRTCLYYGVLPQLVDQPDDIEALMSQSRRFAGEMGLAESGERLVVLAGHPVGTSLSRKMLIVEELE